MALLHQLSLLIGCVIVINGQDYVGRKRGPTLPDKCAGVSCLLVQCLNPVTRPGECCPECPTLPHRCATVFCGAVDCANPVMGPNGCCLVCPVKPPRCSLVRCGLPPNCIDTYIPPGECCPVCRRGRPCQYKGVLRKDGEKFKDSCNTCTCNDGHVSCTKIACGPKPGRCPRSSEIGPCVIECSGDHDCSGRRKCCSMGCGRVCLLPKQGGGSGCLGRVCPLLRCASQYTPPGSCCPVCKPIDPIPKDCRSFPCPAIYCEGQYKPAGQCCPVCPNTTY